MIWIWIKLRSLIDTSHKYAWFFFIKIPPLNPQKLTQKNVQKQSHNVKISKKQILDPRRNLMTSILGRVLSSIQVSWKSVESLCHPAHKQLTDMDKNITSLAEVITVSLGPLARFPGGAFLCACSPCLCMCSLWILWFPPATQRCAGEVN